MKMQDEKNECCFSCKFFKKVSQQRKKLTEGETCWKGFCRAHPPVEKTAGSWTFPVVWGDDWCGEWRPKNGRHASFSDAFRELYKDAMNFRAKGIELSELHVDRNAMSILKDWMSNAEQEGIEKPNISSGIRYAQSRIEQLVVLLYREGKGEKL